MAITKAVIRSWSRLGQRATFFGIAMPEIVEADNDVIVTPADLAILSNLDRFAAKYPDNFLNVGIAEQNMIGISSGLAMEGHCVFTTTYASFIAVRSLEHVRQHLSNLSLNVKLVGTAAGVVAARSGVAHWASEDLAFMRVLPNMTVMSAADSYEAYQMAHYAAKTQGPMYIRLNGSPNCPMIYDETYKFEMEKISVIQEGSDVALLGTGLMVHEAKKTAELLNEQGISCTVANVHTIKPLDTATLDDIFKNHKLIVTMEEHNVLGGLGSAIAEYKATKEMAPRQIFIGIPDTFIDAGSVSYMWEKFGITAPQVADKIVRVLKEKG